MKLFRVAGVPVIAHWSLLLLVGLFAAWSTWQDGPDGLWHVLVLSCAFVGSVLVHELGHALVAQRLGMGILGIVLLPFGGATQLQMSWASPGQDALVSVAGPMASLALGGAAMGLGWGLGWEDGMIIGAVNLGLGLFNLIPAFPLDGGRVLRALLAMRVGVIAATQVALVLGSFIAMVFLVLGLINTQVELALIAMFLLLAQQRERVMMDALGG